MLPIGGVEGVVPKRELQQEGGEIVVSNVVNFGVVQSYGVENGSAPYNIQYTKKAKMRMCKRLCPSTRLRSGSMEFS